MAARVTEGRGPETPPVGHELRLIHRTQIVAQVHHDLLPRLEVPGRSDAADPNEYVPVYTPVWLPHTVKTRVLTVLKSTPWLKVAFTMLPTATS